MKTAMLCLSLLALPSCAVPFARLSDDVSVRQVAWPQGRFLRRVETSARNTGSVPLLLMAKCESSGGTMDVRHLVLEPGETKTFVDKVPSSVDGSASVSCDWYRR